MTTEDIKVIVNGREETSGITKTLLTATDLTEDRIVNGVNTSGIKYGEQYTLTITGFAQNANQVKIRIPAGVLTDKYENSNKETDLIVYNVLKSAEGESNATSAFLGEAVATTLYPTDLTELTSLERQNIEKVVFESNIQGSKETEVQRIWDVSAQGDGSIIAWTTGTTAPYTVHIGSNDEIFGNQNSSYLFSYIGYSSSCTAQTAIENIDLLNVSSVRKMNWMFNSTGYTSMTSFDLGNEFDTSNVNEMSAMFNNTGYKVMTNLDLGDKFDTSSVTTMAQMFGSTGYTAMTSLDLGDNFNTSNVTMMTSMFLDCGYKKMTNLNLGDKFDTSNVEYMFQMFCGTGQKAMTSLDLGDKFDTSKVTTMASMFSYTGADAMTALDLGPKFTQMPETNGDIFKNTGKSGECVIYAPESIYKSKNAFRLNSGDSSETSEDLQYTRGTINPIYKPEWTKISSALDTVNKTLNVTVKGSAYKNQTIDSNVTINYASDITSTLTPEDITVFVDGVEVTSAINPIIAASTGTISTNETSGKTEVTHTITLSNLEEAARRANIPYKELSGNIAIKINGRAEATTTYLNNVLKDEYGNQSMREIDTTGTWLNITFGDGETDRNASGTMFADFVRPEFTYEFANTTIGKGPSGNKKVSVIFDVTDKYFNSSELTSDLITVKVANEEVNISVNVTKTLTKQKDIIINTETNAVSYKNTGYTLKTNERKVGERYELLVEGLEQLDENGLSNGYTYSGPMTVAFPSGKVTDLSGNTNVATTIIIGVDETDGNPGIETVPYLPTGYSYVEGTIDTGYTIQDSTGNQYVWVEVPRSATVYPTAGLSITDFTDAEYTAIENDLHTYTSVYREDGYEDIWYSEDQHGMTETEYNTLKKKMLKSIYKNGGFYVGRYETGIDYNDSNGYRTASGAATQTPVIKQNAYTYNYVTNKQAQELASTMATGNYTSSLMFGVQWDLVLKYMETKGATQSELKSNSTSWGNYNNNLWTVSNTSAKYSTDNGNSYSATPYTKTADANVLLTTGASSEFNKAGIYDLAGNVREWTLENISSSDLHGTTRSGQFSGGGTTGFSSYHYGYSTERNEADIGFRVALYKNDEASNNEQKAEIVDVVDPVWELVNIDREAQTIKIRAKDKYFDRTEITEDNITVYVDGAISTAVRKDITTTPPTDIMGTVDGEEKVIGKEYTLKLLNIESTDGIGNESDYTTFTPTNLTTDSLNNNAGFKYRNDNGGDISIKISTGTIYDTSGNTNKEQEFEIGDIDVTKPEIFEVQKIKDTTNLTETIIFNVTDLHYDETQQIIADEIETFIDGTEVTGIQKNISFKEIIYNEKVIGQQYTLVLSNIVEATYQTGKEYLEWSGTLQVKVDENAIKDINENPLNASTTTISDFVDFIKPQITYTHQSSDINYGNKTYTMTFEVTDKYYTSGQIGLSDLTIQMKNGQKDSNVNEIVNDLKQAALDGKVNIALNKQDKTATFRKTTSGAIEETSSEHVIGHTYTLTISNLEQLEIEENHTTADYSGIITVAIAGSVIEDNGTSGDGTNLNGNNATTITSGVDIPGGTGSSTSEAVVDVVDPLITKVSSTASAIDPSNKESSTATITFKGTDTYFNESTLTTDNIKVIVNGAEVTSGISKTLSTATDLTEERIENGVNKTGVKYGEQYTLTITGFAQNANQVKVRIPAGKVTDQYGNSNKETDLIVYNVLKSTASETEASSAFLGESISSTLYPTSLTELTPLERRNIEKVVFESSIQGSKETGVQRIWDVSAQGDGSIIAWTSNTTAPYTVHIGSNDEIFGNQNSSYLFASIGANSSCTAQTVIENIDLLNVCSVTDMSCMFIATGNNAMTSLDLGDKFDTSNVTDMRTYVRFYRK